MWINELFYVNYLEQFQLYSNNNDEYNVNNTTTATTSCFLQPSL